MSTCLSLICILLWHIVYGNSNVLKHLISMLVHPADINVFNLSKRKFNGNHWTCNRVFRLEKLDSFIYLFLTQFCSQKNLPELGMELGGLGTEVLPHRIGALATHRQQHTLMPTYLPFPASEIYIDISGFWAANSKKQYIWRHHLGQHFGISTDILY